MAMAEQRASSGPATTEQTTQTAAVQQHATHQCWMLHVYCMPMEVLPFIFFYEMLHYLFLLFLFFNRIQQMFHGRIMEDKANGCENIHRIIYNSYKAKPH